MPSRHAEPTVRVLLLITSAVVLLLTIMLVFIVRPTNSTLVWVFVGVVAAAVGSLVFSAGAMAIRRLVDRRIERHREEGTRLTAEGKRADEAKREQSTQEQSVPTERSAPIRLEQEPSEQLERKSLAGESQARDRPHFTTDPSNPSRPRAAPAVVGSVPVKSPEAVAAVLSEIEPFRWLDEQVLRHAAERWAQRVVAKGTTIFVQEELGDRMFVLVEGMVKLVMRSSGGDVIELVRHTPPAVFGEVAVLDGGPREASAEAVQQSRLVVVTREDFLRLLRSDAQVADAMLRSLGTMVRRTTRQIGDLVFLDVQGRVARQLLQLAGGAGTSTPPITRSEIADMVGGARQTVNLALRRLEQRGHIRMAGRRIHILDQEALRRRAAGR